MQIHPRPRLDAVTAALDTLRLLLVRLAAALLDAYAADGGPRGFRGRWLRRRSRGRGSGMRHAARALVRRLKRGSLSMRVEALSRAVTHTEWLDALVARLMALAPFARLTPVAPGVQDLIFYEDFGAVAAPDTS